MDPNRQQHGTGLPDPQTAYQNLFDGVGQRVFFHKLAQLRPQYMPRNAKQASDLLDLRGKLRLVDQEQAVKEADDAFDPFAAANMALDGVLAQHGYTSVKQAYEQEEHMAIGKMAADLAEDPDLYNSVLSLKAHQAEQFLAQAQQQ